MTIIFTWAVLSVVCLGGVVAGGVVGWLLALAWIAEEEATYEMKMRLAYKECGKVARKIHKQKLMIKKLKAQIPAAPKAVKQAN